MKEIVRLVLVLTVISGVAGLLLAFTNAATEARIADLQAAEKLRALTAVLPAFDNQPNASTNTVNEEGATWVFYVARQAGQYVGCAFESSSAKGYGGTVRIMIGVGADGAVREVQVLEQNETPGLGTRVKEAGFINQFKGRRAAEAGGLRVKKDGGDIDAVTGATISSRAVTEAVRRGLQVYARHAAEIARTGE